MPSGRARKIDKATIALTFKFDCDRFLRFRLASEGEQERLGVPSAGYSARPGIQLIREAGRRWEIAKYEDLIYILGEADVHYDRKSDSDPEIGAREFDKVEDLFDVLSAAEPPQAIVEAEFDVPDDITPGLARLYADYDLAPVRVRPDVLWIRPARTGAPLIGTVAEDVAWEIHVIDIKMAAEPSLRHFVEVTFYALALDQALRIRGLSDRYAVSAEGLIWPGTHDANAFRSLFRDLVAQGTEDPSTTALIETLAPVPYEVYEVHVEQFLRERLPRVLAQAPHDANWHVAPTCQLCPYLEHCKGEAHATDHLSRIAWITRGQAEVLREHGLRTTAELADAIRTDSPKWQAAVAASHQLRAAAPALLARADSLATNDTRLAERRKVALMPRWADMHIFLTVHFDLGTGITFAMAASRVYFRPDAPQGTRPRTDFHDFIVDRVDGMNPDTERARLIEFIDVITGWLHEADEYNRQLREQRRVRGERDSAYGKVRVHFYAWDGLEFKQLRRMLERHMAHPQVIERVELLVRLFPPESRLPDPETFRSQPGTAVKDVFRLLVGVPVAHDYTLIEVANEFYPHINPENGRPWEHRLDYGFVTELSDQIPFERAYELWQDRVMLKHRDGRRYTRGEIYDGIRAGLKTRIDALEDVVSRLRSEHGDRLVLRKSPFSAEEPPSRRIRLPETGRMLNALQQLDVASREIEVRGIRSLPIEEREARFHSIRGILPASGYGAQIEEARRKHPRYASAELLAFTFAPTSRDARVNEGDFTLALSNETHPNQPNEEPLDLEIRWRIHAGLSVEGALAEVREQDLGDWTAHVTLARLLAVEVAALGATSDPPYLILKPGMPELFRFARAMNFLNFDAAMALDTIHADFASDQLLRVLRAVGGRAGASAIGGSG